MKWLLPFLLIALFHQAESLSQDLLILNERDSIPCRITRLDADSAIHYKSIVISDPFVGYLERSSYTQIVPAFYTNRKRANNPNNGLGFLDLGVNYIAVPFNPIIDLIVEDSSLLNGLSGKYSFSASFLKFFHTRDPFRPDYDQPSHLGVGLHFSSFTQSAQSTDFQPIDSITNHLTRQTVMASLLISYYTQYRFTTYFVLQPGIMIDRYSGYYGSPIQSRAMPFYLGMSIHQKLFDIAERVSLFCSVNPFLLVVDSGKIDYGLTNYNTTALYDRPHLGYGISAGLSLRYFY